MRLLKNGEGLFFPIPDEYEEMFKPLLEKDLTFILEPVRNGVGILVAKENKLLGLYPLDQRFKLLLRQINKEM